LTAKEIITALEEVLKEALKLVKVRVFLVGSELVGTEHGSLMYLEPEPEPDPPGDAEASAAPTDRRLSMRQGSMRASNLAPGQVRGLSNPYLGPYVAPI